MEISCVLFLLFAFLSMPGFLPPLDPFVETPFCELSHLSTGSVNYQSLGKFPRHLFRIRFFIPHCRVSTISTALVLHHFFRHQRTVAGTKERI